MRFSVSDGVVTVLTVLVAGYLLASFWSDLDAITTRGDEPVLGTVTFKKQTATRRSAQSQVWERLQNSSPVYESDTLRTGDGSEAVIHFDDGLALDLQENTMLRLSLQGKVRTVDFTEGTVTLQGRGTGALALGQSGKTLTLSEDAQLVLTKTADTMSLELAQGTASVTDASGQAQALSTLQALDLDTKSGAAQVRSVDLVPRSPAPGGRLLDEGTKPTPVELIFQIGPEGPDPNTVEVEVSDQPEFSHPRRQPGSPMPAEAGLYRGAFDLEPGTWYWRVSAPGGASKTRSFTLFRTPPPTPISPAEGTNIAYRKTLPGMAFSWSEHELVSSWVFELSRSRDFQSPEVRRRTTLNRLTIDALAEGTWYWRVVPTTAATVLVPAEPEVRSLTVVRRPEMQAIQPEVPVEGTVVQTQELSTKGLAFTWNPVAEARGYQLTVRDGPGAGSRVLGRFTSTTPYLLLTPEQLRPLSEGTSYWDLRWQDDEENLSPAAPPRSLKTVDGAMALRPTYPPDGYLIGEPFITNTRFAWKSNLALKTTFQVSRQREFTELVYEAPADDGTRLGKDWGLGTFYWRLSSLNANGTVFVQTEPRRFDVLGPLEPARLSDPPAGSVVLLPEGQDRDLVWPGVPGADYYRVSLSQSTPGGAIQRFQAEVDQREGGPNTLRLPFSRIPEGDYLARIQAFHRESERSTSIIGLYGESPFAFKRLFNPTIQTPPDGASIEGLDALRRGVSLSWTTATPSERTTVEIRRGTTVVARLTAEGQSLTWPKVAPGDYSWTVGGTVAGFDLSATGRFVVAPVRPLEAPQNLVPDQSVWGVSQLRNLKTFDLTWEPVPQAQVYVVTLYRDDQIQPLYQTTVSTPRLVLDKSRFLQRGRFHWTVEARVLAPDGSLEQPGVVARAGFAIELPVLEAPQLLEDQRFYGR